MCICLIVNIFSKRGKMHSIHSPLFLQFSFVKREIACRPIFVLRRSRQMAWIFHFKWSVNTHKNAGVCRVTSSWQVHRAIKTLFRPLECVQVSPIKFVHILSRIGKEEWQIVFRQDVKISKREKMPHLQSTHHLAFGREYLHWPVVSLFSKFLTVFVASKCKIKEAVKST